jgi:serine/threonine protein phosphatase PrpC
MLEPRRTIFRNMAQKFIEMVGITDVGSVRQYNEDSIAIDPEKGVMALADGMGGHRAGEVASRLAIESVSNELESRIVEFGNAAGPHSPRLALDQSIKRANKAVYSTAQANAAYQGMGTTVAVAVFYDNAVTLGHIGDSRIYRLRGNALQLLTRDDSLLRDQVELGIIAAADARDSHNRSLVTRALGIGDDVAPHIHEEQTLPGDIFLLCSDGLNDLVDDADIELIVYSLKTNLALAAHHLIQTAKDNGGYDNVSVILGRVLKPFPPASQRRWIARLFRWLSVRRQA